MKAIHEIIMTASHLSGAKSFAAVQVSSTPEMECHILPPPGGHLMILKTAVALNPDNA
jgi:hypothetical protein